MLQITIPKADCWDEKTNQFLSFPDTTIVLEHSLISVSKWEAKWHKPFIGKTQKTQDEIADYVRCMTITPNVKPEVYACLSKKNIDDVVAYIDDPMTASTVNDHGSRKSSREIVTSELIYYWMVSLEIPFECQKWHLNRLMMLIKICNAKNLPDKKISKRSTMQQNAALNAMRRQRARSRG